MTNDRIWDATSECCDVLDAGLALEQRAGFTAQPDKWW